MPLLTYKSRKLFWWKLTDGTGAVVDRGEYGLATAAAATADFEKLVRLGMEALGIHEGTATPPPPPPPPPPPTTAAVWTEMAGPAAGDATDWRIVWDGLTPAKYGLSSGRWDTSHDLPLLAQAINDGFGPLTDLPAGEAIFLEDTTGRRWDLHAGDGPPTTPPPPPPADPNPLLRAVDAGGAGGDL